ncbi:MAG: flagellar protein FlaG [Pseudomonadota bacterium]
MDAIENIKSQLMKSPERASRPFISRENASKAEKTDTEAPKEKTVKTRGNPEVTMEQVSEAVKKYADSLQTDLKIQVHEGTGRIMVKVISKEDGRVIREVPSEKLLNLAAKMEALSGLLFDEKV